MDKHTIIISIFFLGHVVFNCITQYQIYKASLSPNRKLILSILVWLLPIVGSVIIYWIVRAGPPTGAHNYPNKRDIENIGNDPGQYV
jgi:hypothetical protein